MPPRRRRRALETRCAQVEAPKSAGPEAARDSACPARASSSGPISRGPGGGGHQVPAPRAISCLPSPPARLSEAQIDDFRDSRCKNAARSLSQSSIIMKMTGRSNYTTKHLKVYTLALCNGSGPEGVQLPTPAAVARAADVSGGRYVVGNCLFRTCRRL